MKIRNTRVAFIVLFILIICLVILCTFLIAERNVTDRIQAAYEQGEQNGYEKGISDRNEDIDWISSLPPWEQYKRGYVCYRYGDRMYHFSDCDNIPSSYNLVPEDFALVKGAMACTKCMPGSKNKFHIEFTGE